MKQTITSFFDSREHANNAVLSLKQAGISAADIELSPETASSDYAATGSRPAKGFWASLEEMFGDTDDHATYAEGVRRGGVMVTAKVDDTQVDEAVEILERHGSVDLNEREATWRTEGWTAGSAVTGGGVASTGAGPIRSVAAPESEALSAYSSTKPVAAVPAGSVSHSAKGDEVLQVVEEQLSVGKRAVNRGKVRLHSYVVETPVSEAVTLRDEKVSVERRPVDRILGATDLGVDAFKDRTIEMEEIDEEAVVGKTVRVVEEIGIRKDVTDKVHTVSDTVRSTKVDIDDGRVTDAGRTGLMGGFASELAKDMEVVGADGVHVGVIDHVDGATIKLKKMDTAAGGQHHLIPADWISSVNGKAMLKVSAADAKARWTPAG